MCGDLGDILRSGFLNDNEEVAAYFKAWPKIAETLINEAEMGNVRGLKFVPLVLEELEGFFFAQWISMLMRGCLWGACHEFVPGERVPSEWWGSEMPIYIG